MKKPTWWETLQAVVQREEDILTAIRVEERVYRLPQEEAKARRAIGSSGPTSFGLPPEVAVVGYGKKHIYVCAVYDGATWIKPVPREDTPGRAPFIGGW